MKVQIVYSPDGGPAESFSTRLITEFTTDSYDKVETESEAVSLKAEEPISTYVDDKLYATYYMGSKNETTFKPAKKNPDFKLHVSNHDPNILVNRHYTTVGGATRFGALLTPKNPLNMKEMCKWLEEQGMPTNVKDCSEFGVSHPNGVFIYDKQVTKIDEQDYIYFVDVKFKARPNDGTNINYPEVDIEGYKYPSY